MIEKVFCLHCNVDIEDYAVFDTRGRSLTIEVNNGDQVEGSVVLLNKDKTKRLIDFLQRNLEELD